MFFQANLSSLKHRLQLEGEITVRNANTRWVLSDQMHRMVAK